MSFDKPKEPGSLSADGSQYSIPHRSKFFAPWQIEATAPTWRDVWAILRRRYRPSLRIGIRLNVEGTSRILKDVWTAPRVEQQMGGSPLLFRVPIRRVEESE